MSHQATYSKLFTPPKFLEMPAVAISFSPTGVSFFLAKNTEKGLVPDHFGFLPLPAGTFSQGEILKRENVIKALLDIRRKTGVSFARFSLPEEKTYIFKIRLPQLPAKEIRDLLDFKIEENVPLSAKEAVFDYEIIPRRRQQDWLDTVVSVAPLEYVEAIQAIFESAGLTPVLFSPEANNVAKSIIKNSNQQAVVIVNFKEASITLSLAISGVVCQTSSLNFGSSTFTDLLAKYLKISPAEATMVKTEKLYNENPDSMEIFSYLINTISALKDEIYRFISYCNEKKDIADQIDRIILCGRDATIVGLDKYLAMNLDLRVEVANVWINNFDINNYVPAINRADSEDLAVVNGLSLL